jgi:hypothetical protein
LKADVSECSAAVRNARPQTICPFCKALEALRAGCGTCSATGYARRGQASGVPAELLDPKDPMVWVSGQARSVWDYIPADDMFGGGK